LPVLTKRERLSRIHHFCSDHHKDLACQVVIKETGARGPVYGGRWHVHERRYLEPWELQAQRLAASNPEEFERAQLKIHDLSLSLKQSDSVEDLITPMILDVGSRRSGKSRKVAGKSVVSAVAHPGKAGEVISPTFPKSGIMRRYIRQMMPVDWIEEENKADRWMRLFNGTEIKFLSSHNPDSLIGEGVGWIGMDEVQSIGELAWSLALPALSDSGTAMQLWAGGTPRMGWFKTLFEQFRTMPASAGRWIHCTYKDNPYIETGKGTVFDLARHVMDPRRRAMELDGLFESEEGLVTYRFNRATHDRSWEAWLATPEHRRQGEDITRQYCLEHLDCDADYIHGVDYGINKQFAVVFKVMRIGGHVCLWAIDEVMIHPHAVKASMRKGDVQKLARCLQDREYYPAAVCDDVTGPKGGGDYHLGQAIDRHGNPLFEIFHFSKSKSKLSRANAVNALFGNEYGVIRAYVDVKRCPDLVYAFENQEIVRGIPGRSAPNERTVHDPPDAFGYPVRYLMPAEVDFEGLERKAA